MRFSQRIGISSVRLELQVNSMDEALRNKLWNIFSNEMFSNAFQYAGLVAKYLPSEEFYLKLKKIWHEFLCFTIDSIPSTKEEIIKAIKHIFFSTEWYFVYDFIEFTLQLNAYSDINIVKAYNEVLESEKSAYRVVGKTFLRLTEEIEIDNVNSVLNIALPFEVVKKHFEASLSLLSNRSNPDYRNSIKESISAVEATCKILTDSSADTLGKALTKLENKYGLHRALRTGFSAIYGYSSDADGIRHAMMDIPNTGYDDALFYLVICSAFVNYLISKLANL